MIFGHWLVSNYHVWFDDLTSGRVNSTASFRSLKYPDSVLLVLHKDILAR
jgi:hypothetical protein